jgi:hypothetical protein
MNARYLTICFGALIAVALPQASLAAEQAPSVTPLMERAFAFHEQGPDQLRQFVYRTRMIYSLSQADVVKAYEATRKAEAPATADQPRVASTKPEGR